MTLWGAHSELPKEATLSNKVEVMIQSAEEMKKIFKSWRITGRVAIATDKPKKENKAEEPTPNPPSD